MLDLCDRLLDLNPEMRPTTQQIFFHPFLREMLPTNQLVEIDVLKKCELPLLNMVMRNVECDVCTTKQQTTNDKETTLNFTVGSRWES